MGVVTQIGASVRATTVNAWMSQTAAAIRVESDHLTQLDAAIGDGDHGINMHRGFDAVEAALAGAADDQPPGRILILAGKTLVSTVGGASGPLWGTALRRAGRSMGDGSEIDGGALPAALDECVAAVRELGTAQPGDKTMVDALQPAVDTLRKSLAEGVPLARALDAAADAADDGARATIPMQARRGRASYLGERSIGHQDPGATSIALAIRALAQVVAEEG